MEFIYRGGNRYGRFGKIIIGSYLWGDDELRKGLTRGSGFVGTFFFRRGSST